MLYLFSLLRYGRRPSYKTLFQIPHSSSQFPKHRAEDADTQITDRKTAAKMKTTSASNHSKIDSIVAVVTPLPDEFFYDLPQVSLDTGNCGGGTGPLIPECGDLGRERHFFLKPAAKPNEFEVPCTSVALASLADASCAIDDNHDDDSVMEASAILFKMKNDVNYAKDATKIVEMAVEMLSENQTGSHDTEDDDFNQDNCSFESSHAAPPKNSEFFHPDRLAIDEDADEVNQLHQYVRKDLLEIFVIPQVSAESESSDDDDAFDDSANGSATTSSPDGKDSPDGPKTRGLSTRRRLSVSPTTSIPAQRYYPGRVGFRCVHCSNARRKSTTKAAFYPLRLKNIYREVCAWQRIHFKNCPMVPSEVREHYEHLKKADPSRGKVRYWESSARKIGLENNQNRDDGIVFAATL